MGDWIVVGGAVVGGVVVGGVVVVLAAIVVVVVDRVGGFVVVGPVELFELQAAPISSTTPSARRTLSLMLRLPSLLPR